MVTIENAAIERYHKNFENTKIHIEVLKRLILQKCANSTLTSREKLKWKRRRFSIIRTLKKSITFSQNCTWNFVLA